MESNNKLQLKSFGECMIEISLNSSKEKSMSIGGDTFNACATAALRGLSVEYTTRVGGDSNKKFLEDEMQKFPLKLNSISDAARNGSYEIALTENGERSFSYDRKNSAASKLTYRDLGENYLENTEAFYNSGITMSLSPNLEKCVQDVMKKASQKSVKTFFDINYRSKLWDVDSAYQSIKELIQFVDVLFFSEEDREIVDRLFGRDLVKVDKIIIERKGSEGCVVYNLGCAKPILGHPVKPIDTTGAGDVFTGSFIAEFLKTDDLYQSAETANILAAKHTECRGGIPHKGII